MLIWRWQIFLVVNNSLSCQGRDAEDKQRSVENSLKKIPASQSISRTGKQSAASEPGPLATNPICSAERERAAMHLQNKQGPPLASRLACKSEDEEDEDMKRSSDSGASNDELVILPRVRSCATDNSDNGSASDNSDCESENNEIAHLSDEFKPESAQDPLPYNTEMDFPPLSTTRSGIIPRPMETPALWKMHGQWEIPLSFHPHVIPTATLAKGATAPAQARVQRKAKAPQINSNTSAPPAAVPQQEAYDLLVDFPALQPPKRPFAFGALQKGNPKTEDAKRQRWPIPPPNASKGSRMENVPREVSPICAGDQKSVADLQTFGTGSERSSPTISCRKRKANKQPPPRGNKSAMCLCLAVLSALLYVCQLWILFYAIFTTLCSYICTNLCTHPCLSVFDINDMIALATHLSQEETLLHRICNSANFAAVQRTKFYPFPSVI